MQRRIPERLETSARQLDERWGRLVDRFDQRRPRAYALRRQDDQLHPPVVGHAPTLREPALLESVHHAGDVRRVASPCVGERPHRPSVHGVEHGERPRVVRRQLQLGERAVPLRPCEEKEIEEQPPRFRGERRLVPRGSLSHGKTLVAVRIYFKRFHH
jgi:hypothetical protein